VLAGVVRVSTSVPGRRPATLRYAGPGELVGLVPALAESGIFAAHAVTDATLAMLSLAQIEGAAMERHEIAWDIARLVARWSADAMQNLVIEGLATTRTKVARHLLSVAASTPDGTLLAHVTHQQLANAVGTAREVVSRVLRHFTELDAVLTERGRIVVLDATALAAIGDERGDRDR
jgi:CRP/FNR family transcriptional regulator, cyclic AMP receptor protein